MGVKNEFGDDGTPADWPTLSRRSDELTKDEFAHQLEYLGPFVTAQVLQKKSSKAGCYVKREAEKPDGNDYAAYANICGLLSLRLDSFYPMPVLVELGEATERVRRLGDLSRVHLKALRDLKGD